MIHKLPRRLEMWGSERQMQVDVCGCEEPGMFYCGLLGILMGPPQCKGCRYVERCDMCERFVSDEDACAEVVRVKGGRCGHDPDGYVVWLPA